MSSINNFQNKDEASHFSREGQYYPNTTGERVATHIPGTEAHAERNELQGRTSPGARVMAKVPGTAEHERKRELHREVGTNPAHDANDTYGSTGRGDVSSTQPGANQAGIYGASTADPVDTTDRGLGNIPSTGAAQGATPVRNEYGAGTENRVSVSDKVIGATEKVLGKALNKPTMVEKGVERQTIGKEQSNTPTTTGGQSGAQPGTQTLGF